MKVLSYISILVFSVAAIVCGAVRETTEAVAFICALAWVIIFLFYYKKGD